MEEQWEEGCDGLIIRTDWQKKVGMLEGTFGATKEMEEKAQQGPRFSKEVVDWINAKKGQLKLFLEDSGVADKFIMQTADVNHIMNVTNLDQIKKKEHHQKR